MPFEEPTRLAASHLLLQLLCHRFPKVRLCAADALYTRIESSGDELGLEDEEIEEITELVLGTHWDAAVN